MWVHIYQSWTEKELKNAYIGEVIECDFTKSDCWFVFYWRTATNITYGRDSNWLYCTRPAQLWWCAWTIPSSIYSRGTIKKIEIELYSSSTKNWWGISYWVDTMFTRRWSDAIDSNWGSSNATIVWDSPAWWYTFTIDLENKIISSSDTLITQTLTDANVSTIRNYRSWWNLNIVSMIVPANTYSYIKKATFYF